MFRGRAGNSALLVQSRAAWLCHVRSQNRLSTWGLTPLLEHKAPREDWSRVLRPHLILFFLTLAFASGASEVLIDDANPLTLPNPGAHELRIISPQMLELNLITTKEPVPAPLQQWDFISTNGVARLPVPGEFSVPRGSTKIPVTKVGFKRRVL